MIYVIAQCDCCGKTNPLASRTVATGTQEVAKVMVFADVYFPHNRQPERNLFCTDCAEKLGLLIPCPGEAHGNPNIDHCTICAPRWNQVPATPAPKIMIADLDRIRSERLALQELD